MKDSREAIATSCMMFIATFVLQAVFVFQGLDVTDTGFHLVHQVESVRFPIDPARVSPATFLSDLAGGMWLCLSGGRSLLWARIGGVTLYSLNASIITSILLSYFDRVRVFVTVLVCSFFVTMRLGVDIIDYYTLPSFLMNVELWLFHVLLKAGGDTRKTGLISCAMGFLGVPVMLCRVSLVSAVLIPAALLARETMRGKDLSAAFRALLFSAVGALCSAAVFAAVYLKLGVIGPVTKECVLPADVLGLAHHGIGEIGFRCLRDAFIVALLGTSAAGTLWGLSLLDRRGWGRAPVDLAIAAVVLLPVLFGMHGGQNVDKLAYRYIFAAAGCAMVWTLAELHGKSLDKRLELLALAGTMTMVVTPLGSNTGLVKMFYGMWLILPLMILASERRMPGGTAAWFFGMRPRTKTVLAVTACLSLFFHLNNVYRDDKNRLHLSEPFEDRALTGIHSTRERVRVVDELLRQVERRLGRGEDALMVGNIPMIHYLTGTRAALGNPWISLEPLHVVVARQDRLVASGRLPAVLVLAKVNTRKSSWPKDSRPDSDGRGGEIIEYLRHEYLVRLKYEKRWENEAFAVYERPRTVEGRNRGLGTRVGVSGDGGSMKGVSRGMPWVPHVPGSQDGVPR